MLGGILFIIAGVLIAVYPKLLSMIVAVVLIFIGITLTAISHHYKKMAKHFENPYIDLFFRF